MEMNNIGIICAFIIKVISILGIWVFLGIIAFRIRKGCFWYGVAFGPFGWFIAHALNVSELVNQQIIMNSRIADINCKMNHVLKQISDVN